MAGVSFTFKLAALNGTQTNVFKAHPCALSVPAALIGTQTNVFKVHQCTLSGRGDGWGKF